MLASSDSPTFPIVFSSFSNWKDSAVVAMRFSAYLSLLGLAVGVASARRSLQHVGKKDRATNNHQHQRAQHSSKAKRGAEYTTGPSYLTNKTARKSSFRPLLCIEMALKCIQPLLLMGPRFPMSTLTSESLTPASCLSHRPRMKQANCTFGFTHLRTLQLPMKS